MTKLERAIKEAEQLPSDIREQLGEKPFTTYTSIWRCGTTLMLGSANWTPAKGAMGRMFLRP